MIYLYFFISLFVILTANVFMIINNVILLSFVWWVVMFVGGGILVMLATFFNYIYNEKEV